MSALTIATIAVPIQAPLSLQYERQGDVFRCFDNTLASQVRSEKRRYTGTTSYLTSTEKATLEAACDLDATVSVTLNVGGVSSTFDAIVRVDAELQQIGLWFARLDIREV
jgi:hypothetical protein